MHQLYIKPQVYKYKGMKEFAEAFNVNENDLLFTERFLYDRFIKALGLKCKVLCRDPYGMGEPHDDMIDNINAEVRKLEFKRVISIGGGSVIDIAKIIALKDNMPSSDLFKKLKPVVKEKQLVIVPTTCGTGSEMTNISIVHILEKDTKMGLADDEIYADQAVLMPELVKDLPYKFFVFSAIDALVHATESYVSPKANSFTRIFSIKACEMILDGFGRMIREGQEAGKRTGGRLSRGKQYGGDSFWKRGSRGCACPGLSVGRSISCGARRIELPIFQ